MTSLSRSLLVAGTETRSCGPRKISEALIASLTVGPALRTTIRLPSSRNVTCFGESMERVVAPRSSRMDRETETRLAGL